MEQDTKSGRHQNTQRIASVLDCIARHPEHGVRLVDLATEIGLGKGTLHRIMAGLVDGGLAEQEPVTRRFFIGRRVMNWAASGRRRFSLVEQMKPVLREICLQCGDTVYLTVRQGDEAIYVDRHEGSYPLKALPVEVGARRPLGIGAAPMAILAFQPQAEIDRIMALQRAEREAFGIGNELFSALIAKAQKLTYSLHQGEVLPGMVAIGVPLLDDQGIPVAAISVAASAARLPEKRRGEIAAIIRGAIADTQVLG